MIDWLISRLGGWIVVAIIGAIIIGALNLLAKTGKLIRAGIETKKTVRKSRLEFAKHGVFANEKLDAVNNTATLKIVLPIVGWLIVYAVLFLTVPTKLF
ncbi:MAG TPA: hypothetical protein VK582_13965 [Pyrinomonadaceae bacterium]|nr:hypothetical protein [Pyrinomonadaceae bacterium]